MFYILDSSYSDALQQINSIQSLIWYGTAPRIYDESHPSRMRNSDNLVGIELYEFTERNAFSFNLFEKKDGEYIDNNVWTVGLR